MSSCSESSSAWFVSAVVGSFSSRFSFVNEKVALSMERLLPNFEKGTAAELHPLLRPLMVRFESQGSLLYGVSVMKRIEAEGSYFKTSDIVGKTQLPLPST